MGAEGFSPRLAQFISKLSPGLQSLLRENDEEIEDISVDTTNNTLRVHSRLFNFTLTPLPGCCGVMVSYDASVTEKSRGKGLGRSLLQFRQDIAKFEKYGLMIATVLDNNEAQKALLTSEGWASATTFVNPKTKNLVRLMYKVLP